MRYMWHLYFLQRILYQRCKNKRVNKLYYKNQEILVKIMLSVIVDMLYSTLIAQSKFFLCSIFFYLFKPKNIFFSSGVQFKKKLDSIGLIKFCEWVYVLLSPRPSFILEA